MCTVIVLHYTIFIYFQDYWVLDAPSSKSCSIWEGNWYAFQESGHCVGPKSSQVQVVSILFDVGSHLFPNHAVRTVHSPLTLCVVGQRSWSVGEEQQPCRGWGSRQSSLNAWLFMQTLSSVTNFHHIPLQNWNVRITLLKLHS